MRWVKNRGLLKGVSRLGAKMSSLSHQAHAFQIGFNGGEGGYQFPVGRVRAMSMDGQDKIDIEVGEGF